MPNGMLDYMHKGHVTEIGSNELLWTIRLPMYWLYEKHAAKHVESLAQSSRSLGDASLANQILKKTQ